ncbi:MAG: response regulator transcription factor [Chloroflexota bacterium]|nr:response regulator transcription factor [Chloroflexota bacterium]
MREPDDERTARDLRLVPGDDEDATGVFVIAPYPSLRAGLRALIERTPGLVVLADAPDDEIDSPDNPDALVIDLDPDQPGLVDRLATRYPEAALLLLIDSPAVYRQLAAPAERATAVLLKDAGATELGAALFAALQGLVVLDPAIARETAAQLAPSFPRAGTNDPIDPLTERERQVLELLALGLPNKTIAIELGISEHTAKFHVGAIMSKLGAASRTEAVAVAARRGLLVL